MDKQQAKQILKNTGYIGNEVGVAFNVVIKSMDKLDMIEQIVNSWDGSIELCENDWKYISKIKKVLEKE